MATLATLIRDLNQQQMFAPTFRVLNSPARVAMRRQQALLNQHTEKFKLLGQVMATQNSATIKLAGKITADYQRILRSTPADVQDVYINSGEIGVSPAESWTSESDVQRTTDTVIEEAVDFDWRSRFREALAQPELTARQRNDLIASMIFALGFCLYVASLRYPQIKDQVQLIDPLIAMGLLLYALHDRSD